jgi:FG-GAP-like repeat
MIHNSSRIGVLTLTGKFFSVSTSEGTGSGYNEVYLTTKTNGIEKILKGHGLQKYPTMRGRFIEKLKGADGSDLVFLATRGAPRTDSEPNSHRMFRLIKRPPRYGNPYNQSWVFAEVRNIGMVWNVNTIASCLVVADLNMDGIDDVLVCNEKQDPALILLQNKDSTWTRLPVPTKSQSTRWSNARVADIDRDGIPDIITVRSGTPGSLKIFKGSGAFPYFDFDQPPMFERSFPFATPNVEVLDVNGDGLLDLYVVQADETVIATNYCAPNMNRKDWWNTGNAPPDWFVPPNDAAADYLLVGTTTPSMFDPIVMNHALPGCGFWAERFGDYRTMILGQGSNSHYGHNLLLKW